MTLVLMIPSVIVELDKVLFAIMEVLMLLKTPVLLVMVEFMIVVVLVFAETIELLDILLIRIVLRFTSDLLMTASVTLDVSMVLLWMMLRFTMDPLILE